jgi:hypothetical protein
MMMQEVVTLNDTLLTMNLAEMITEVDVEKQCAKTASWSTHRKCTKRYLQTDS